MTQGARKKLPEGLLVAWYGDDYTGAAAVMEVLTFAGLPSVLFFDIPTRAQLDMFAGYRGIGIAGVARSKSPQWMAENLLPIFTALSDMGAPITHYKVCSTLDSSPEIGSIGKAAELAQTVFESRWIPLVIAAPEISRYQVFGNLFATVGDETFRLDRHPTMSRHPVTPMHEADVLAHLRRQTKIKTALIDLLSLKAGQADGALYDARDVGARLVAIDILDRETLTQAGRLIWENRGGGLFCIGSQGLEYALTAHWRAVYDHVENTCASGEGPVDIMAVVSGSCSPVTAEQIDRAREVGFEPIRIDPAQAVDETSWQAEIHRVTCAALGILSQGADPIVFSSSGPDDPATGKFNAAVEQSGHSIDDINMSVGCGLGQVLGKLVRKTGLSRGVIAGGDTSSHGASALGIYALTALAPIAPGVALCRAHSDDPGIAGFQIALKGGQMGERNIFEQIRQGGAAA